MHAYDDRKSIVIVLDEKNPANPFLFVIFKKDNKYTLYGEGNRDKKYTKLAYYELVSLLTDDFVISLYSEVVKSAVLSNIESGI